MIAMKKIFALFFTLILAACNANPSPDELKTKLSSTMTNFLYKNINYDSVKTKFRVLEVSYYDDKENYDCNFKVLMQEKGRKDTVGYMFAFISKDFKTVKRTDLLSR